MKFDVRVTRSSDFNRTVEAKDKYEAEQKVQDYIDELNEDPFGTEEYVFNCFLIER